MDEDLSALAYKKLPPEDRDWEIFDRMKRGEKRFRDLQAGIDQVGEDLTNHTGDPNAHHQVEPDPWYHDRRKQTIAGTTIGGVVLAITALIIDYLGA